MNRVPTIHFDGAKICRSPGFRREVGAGVGAAGRLAVVVVFDGFLEFFEDGVEVGENAVVTGAFLEHVVEQADADYEFFGVFFGDVAFSLTLSTMAARSWWPPKLKFMTS